MTATTDDLSVLAYANGFTFWHYRTGDPSAALAETGYFAAAADMLRPGDMLLANTADGGGLYRLDPGPAAVPLTAG